MTTSTTLGCIFMTPLICKVVLGAVVPVDAGGIVVSTFQVVLAPIFLGVGFNTLAPSFCKAGKREREQVIKHLKFRLNDQSRHPNCR